MKKIFRILIILIIIMFIIIFVVILKNKNKLQFKSVETNTKLSNSNIQHNNESFNSINEESTLIVEINNSAYKTIKKEIGKHLNAQNYITVSARQGDNYTDEWIKEFNAKIIKLQMQFPDGTYWNHMEQKENGQSQYLTVSNTPCNHNKYKAKYCNTYKGKLVSKYKYYKNSNRCWGFSSMLSDMIFGEDAKAKKFYDYDSIRIGDQACINKGKNTVLIIDKTDEYVVVAECNADYKTCEINWGRKILKKDLKGFYITRYND